MVLFFPIQQELDCISANGDILGKIKFEGSIDEHIFCIDNESITLSESEKTSISEKIAKLNSGNNAIPMQDDD